MMKLIDYWRTEDRMQIFRRRLMILAEARLWLQFPVLTAHYFSAQVFFFGFLFCALHEMRFTALPLYKKESLKGGR